MSNLKTMHTNILFLQETIKKLESGLLELDELDQMVKSSLEIYERAIILRYKAYENKNISEEQKIEIQPELVNVSEDQPIIMEPIDAVSTNQQENDINESIGTHIETTMVSDQDSAFSFDLFNDTAEVIKDEIIEEETIEHVNITSSSHEEHGIAEEHLIMEQIKRTPIGEENKVFIETFSVIEADLFNQIGMSRLETLNNCFGLNEKFVYINELFNGSKDEFNETIQQIDSDSTYHDALITASVYANKYNWDLESSTVLDFITKLKRRHG